MAEISGAATTSLSQSSSAGSVHPDILMKIHFLVVGGSISGLASAIALCRAGHNVTVLEIEEEAEALWGLHNCTVPPNLSKLLVRWGMGERLTAVTTNSRRIKMMDYHLGDTMGIHNWHQEVLKDSGGDIGYARHSDLRSIMRDCAISLGADLRSGSPVMSISVPESARPSVRLESSEVIEADVIVGADGSTSLVRRQILGQEIREIPLGYTVFNVSISKKQLSADPAFRDHLAEAEEAAMTWLGESHGAIGMVAEDDYTLLVYTPIPGTQEYWGKDVPLPVLLNAMGSCLPLLSEMAQLATSIRCMPVCESPEIDPWVHPAGRLVLVGDAAHPFPRGSTHGYAAAVCDAAALGELFRHLHSDGQISSFLLAYENIRRDRVKTLLQVDIANVLVIAMSPGEQKSQRDRAMREKHAARLDAFAADDGDVAAHWEMEKVLFAYDAEDHAADWWNDWGLLNERATDSVRVRYASVPVFQIQADVQAQEVAAGGD